MVDCMVVSSSILFEWMNRRHLERSFTNPKIIRYFRLNRNRLFCDRRVVHRIPCYKWKWRISEEDLCMLPHIFTVTQHEPTFLYLYAITHARTNTDSHTRPLIHKWMRVRGGVASRESRYSNPKFEYKLFHLTLAFSNTIVHILLVSRAWYIQLRAHSALIKIVCERVL